MKIVNLINQSINQSINGSITISLPFWESEYRHPNPPRVPWKTFSRHQPVSLFHSTRHRVAVVVPENAPAARQTGRGISRTPADRWTLTPLSGRTSIDAWGMTWSTAEHTLSFPDREPAYFPGNISSGPHGERRGPARPSPRSGCLWPRGLWWISLPPASGPRRMFPLYRIARSDLTKKIKRWFVTSESRSNSINQSIEQMITHTDFTLPLRTMEL